MPTNFPPILHILLKQRKYLVVRDAISMTISQELLYAGDTYRDDINAGFLGNQHGVVTARQPDAAAQSMPPGFTASDLFPPTWPINSAGSGIQSSSGSLSASINPLDVRLNGASTSYAPALVADSLFEQGDVYTHTKPRFGWSLRSAMKFWDTVGAVEGIASVLGGLVTTGSYEIADFPAALVKIGQGLSGTGIPAGAVVAGYKDEKTIYMSAAGSATGAVAITVAAGTVTPTNMLGFAWADEVIGWSSDVPVQL